MLTLKKAVSALLLMGHSLVFAADKITTLKNEVVAKNVIATKKTAAAKSVFAQNATKPTAIAAKPTAISAKPTAIAAKPTAIAAKPTAIAAKPTAIAAKPTPVSANTAITNKAAPAPTKATISEKIAVVAKNTGPAKTLVKSTATAENEKKVITPINNFSVTDKAIETDYCGNRWSIGAAAFYFRPTFGGNGLGYSTFSNYGADFFGNVVEVDGAVNYLSNVQPKRDVGFQIEVAYLFDRSSDININWYHLRDGTGGRLPDSTLYAGSASALYAGELNISSDWDAINAELGQYVYFGDLQMLRVHVGLEFANIKNVFTNYPQLTPIGNPVFITADKIWYTGIGPRTGADFYYGISSTNFSFYGKIAGSLLVGNAKQTVSGYHDLGGFNLYSTGNYKQSNKSIVVPELEGKLGIKYDVKFPAGKFKFDLGYSWMTYFDAMVSQVGSGVVSSAISNSVAANFDMNGIYCGFTWIQNV